jgi:hypothetical protein
LKLDGEADSFIKARCQELAKKLYSDHPQALMAIYRIYQLCDHDESF